MKIKKYDHITIWCKRDQWCQQWQMKFVAANSVKHNWLIVLNELDDDWCEQTKNWIYSQVEQLKMLHRIFVLKLQDFPEIYSKATSIEAFHGYWCQQFLKLRAGQLHGADRMVISDSKTWPISYKWDPKNTSRIVNDRNHSREDPLEEVFGGVPRRLKSWLIEKRKISSKKDFDKYWPSVLPPVVWYQSWVNNFINEWPTWSDCIDWCFEKEGGCWIENVVDPGPNQHLYTDMMSEFLLVESHMQLTSDPTDDFIVDTPQGNLRYNTVFRGNDLYILKDKNSTNRKIFNVLCKNISISTRFLTIKWHDPQEVFGISDTQRERIAELIFVYCKSK